MFTRTAILIVSALLLAGTASAEMRSTERSIESSTVGLRLPRSVPASISVAPCETCSAVTLQVTQSSKLYFGRKSVSLAELQKLVVGPTYNVSIYYEPSNNTVSRLVVTDRRQQ